MPSESSGFVSSVDSTSSDFFSSSHTLFPSVMSCVGASFSGSFSSLFGACVSAVLSFSVPATEDSTVNSVSFLSIFLYF